MDNAHILIIDDSRIARRMAGKLLEDAGYRCDETDDGAAGLAAAMQLVPDLILLDCVMPGMDGMQVLRRLRAHFGTCHIPIIMLTSLDDMDHRVEGLTAGADDYVIKPFDQRDLLARVASALRRSQHSLAADPSTKLPGNVVIRRHLQRKLQEDAECSVAYVDLDHFKAYVDFYGFERAGDVIHAVAQILQRAVAKHGGPQDFVGHIGGDDFLLISQPSHVEVVVQNLVESFAAEVPTYYSEQDGARGYITGQDRYGAQRQFPLLSLSVAIVEIRAGCCPAAADVAAFAGHCKQHIKSDRGQGWRRYPYDAKKLVG